MMPVTLLRAHLDSTLLHITDGANEEQGDFAEFTSEDQKNGKARLGPESPDMLARGRVYEKALGEARHNTRIEKFLVMELEKGANLTDYLSLNLPAVRRLKIACWAATCNFVHMVMALIHCKDGGDRKFLYRVLTIAVEFGYVELVKRLTEVEEFDVNRGRRNVDFDEIHCKEVGEHIRRTIHKSGCLYYYAFSDRLTPLNLAAKLGNVEIVNTFLAYIGPFYEVSFTPMQLASLYGDISVLKLLKGRLEATIEYDTGVQALQIATKMRRDEIVKILTDIPEVEKDVKRWYRDRQAHVDAANAILVGAALIASVAFAGWLQPPLGYSPFFGSANLDAGAPTPSGMYPSFVSVEAAFISAGFVVLPPIRSYTTVMVATVVIGMGFVFLELKRLLDSSSYVPIPRTIPLIKVIIRILLQLIKEIIRIWLQ
ncbi:unnamed protein product [Sphagnum tenellum]